MRSTHTYYERWDLEFDGGYCFRHCQQAAARTQITKDGSIQNEASENSPHHRTLAKLTSLSKKGLGLGYGSSLF